MNSTKRTLQTWVTPDSWISQWKYAPDCAAPSKIKLVKYHINFIKYPFDPVHILSFSIELPPIVKYISIYIIYDATLNISYISQLYNDLVLFSCLPPHAWCYLWIIAIVYEDPIMADSYSDKLLWHQNRGRTKTISIPHSTNNFFLYNIQDIRSAFNQVRPMVCCSALFKNKPWTPSDTRKCLRDLH